MDKVQERIPLDAARAASPHGPAAVTVFTTDVSLPRTIEAALESDRFRVSSRQQPQSLAGYLLDRRTDAVLFDLRLPVSTQIGVGRELRRLSMRPAIPVIGLCDAEMSHEERLAALADGFWDVVELPLASDELVAKLGTWTGLKRDVDEMHSCMLLDAETGHYTSQGIKRRLREMMALAQRIDDPISCVVFGADPPPDSLLATGDALMEMGRRFSLALHHQTRNSDVIGRLESLRFLVLAPHTPPAGAVQLAERFTSLSLSCYVDGDYAVTFSAGTAGTDGHNGQMQACPELLLAAANRALNQARSMGVAQVASAFGKLD
jgi:PleD family two-component response regulator